MRLVLLDFYGTDLWEDDIPALLEAIAVPIVIMRFGEPYAIGFPRMTIRSATNAFSDVNEVSPDSGPALAFTRVKGA